MFSRARAQNVIWRDRIFVEDVPALRERLYTAELQVRAEPLKFIGGDVCRQRLPSVAVAKQHKEVRLYTRHPAPLDLAQADVHRLLVQRCFVTHTPAQIDRLEAGPVLFTELAELREDL